MALKSTIFKAELQVNDMDRHYYHCHHLTLARHPSETDERMMLRILAFSQQAHEALTLTKGLSTTDEPDLWRKDLSGVIELWIELGQPDEKRLRKACGLAQHVMIYCYSGRSAEIWWRQNKDKFSRFHNLSILNVSEDTYHQLAQLAQKTMQLTSTRQDGVTWLADNTTNVEVNTDLWKQAEMP